MRSTWTTLVVAAVLAVPIAADGSSINGWSRAGLQRFLQDQGLAPTPSSTVDELRAAAKKQLDALEGAWDQESVSSWARAHGIALPTQSSTKDGVASAVYRAYSDAVDSWSESDLRAWLRERGLPIPAKSRREQLLDVVRAQQDATKDGAESAANNVQTVFRAQTDKLFNGWSDSQLREYLLEQGIVAPNSKREELEVYARKAYGDFRQTAEQAAKVVTDTADDAGAAASKAFQSAEQAATAAVRLPYDFVTDAYENAKDFVYGEWTDSEVEKWLIEHDYIRSPGEKKADELRGLVQDYYRDTVDNAYEAWTDNRLRKWLSSHKIAEAKTAKTREDLLSAVSKNYYWARDTTYHSWGTRELKAWLEARGLIRSAGEKDREEYLKAIEGRYYELRDRAYDSWDRNQLRSYLNKNGIADLPPTATRAQLLEAVEKTYHAADEKVWDTWSDAKLRAWLVRNEFVDAASAANLKRNDLENEISSNFYRSQESLKKLFSTDEAHAWLVAHGYLKSDAQKQRDEVYKLLQQYYSAADSKSSAWLSWSDARIRSWLRAQGVPVRLSSTREELEARMSENYASVQGTLGGFADSIKSYLDYGKEQAGLTIDELRHIVLGAFGPKPKTTTEKVKAEANKLGQRVRAEL